MINNHEATGSGAASKLFWNFKIKRPRLMKKSNRDIKLLFLTRIIRLFAYGFMSVILVLLLAETGLKDGKIGLILTLTLAGDVFVSLWVTTVADRIGRRKMLVLGAVLMALSGLVFVVTNNPWLLTIAAILGIISPSGNEIGPFLSIEQAALSHIIPDHKRTSAFGWYNFAGSFATAIGALTSGWLAKLLLLYSFTALESYRYIMLGYAISGVMLIVIFLKLSAEVESQPVTVEIEKPTIKPKMGLHQSKGIVAKLSALFALDAFAGGFVIQSIMAYWFHTKFGVDTGVLGSIFFGANILAGISALLATNIAARIGLINTMVFTHIPSNILLCLVPLMPNLGLAIALLLLRYSISQMDVPTRQSYTMAVVAPDERTAASGITNIARSIGAAASPALSGLLLANPLFFSAPFFLAGGLKIIYDLFLYKMFLNVRPPEENRLKKEVFDCINADEPC
ncbi:MFS transporter [Desulforegula conservatrix]|uniref:MFS transporter n=1 Tax=Desulforegula conservatrix TaxID=153026 RepID=UPI0004150A2C|nr:MFS transporter [Desulforegula conservatrix]